MRLICIFLSLINLFSLLEALPLREIEKLNAIKNDIASTFISRHHRQHNSNHGAPQTQESLPLSSSSNQADQQAMRSMHAEKSPHNRIFTQQQQHQQQRPSSSPSSSSPSSPPSSSDAQPSTHSARHFNPTTTPISSLSAIATTTSSTAGLNADATTASSSSAPPFAPVSITPPPTTSIQSLSDLRRAKSVSNKDFYAIANSSDILYLSHEVSPLVRSEADYLVNSCQSHYESETQLAERNLNFYDAQLDADQRQEKLVKSTNSLERQTLQWRIQGAIIVTDAAQEIVKQIEGGPQCPDADILAQQLTDSQVHDYAQLETCHRFYERGLKTATKAHLSWFFAFRSVALAKVLHDEWQICVCEQHRVPSQDRHKCKALHTVFQNAVSKCEAAVSEAESAHKLAEEFDAVLDRQNCNTPRVTSIQFVNVTKVTSNDCLLVTKQEQWKPSKCNHHRASKHPRVY